MRNDDRGEDYAGQRWLMAEDEPLTDAELAELQDRDRERIWTCIENCCRFYAATFFIFATLYLIAWPMVQIFILKHNWRR